MFVEELDVVVEVSEVEVLVVVVVVVEVLLVLVDDVLLESELV